MTLMQSQCHSNLSNCKVFKIRKNSREKFVKRTYNWMSNEKNPNYYHFSGSRLFWSSYNKVSMLGIFYCRVKSILALDLRPISEHESHILALDLDLDPSPVSYPGSRPDFYTYTARRKSTGTIWILWYDLRELWPSKSRVKSQAMTLGFRLQTNMC